MEIATKEKMIANIMEDFDFKKVHDIMLKLNWEWQIGGSIGKNPEMAVPSIYKLMKFSEKLLEQVIAKAEHHNQDYFEVQSGGFIASIAVTEGEHTLDLKFILEDAVSFSSDYK